MGAHTYSGVIDVVNDIAVVPPVTRSDAVITADVRNALASDPDINAARIQTSGTVYLRGTFPTYYQISKASQDAWSVPGVVNVVNELTV